jgi:glycosyltransferase involved in cell wall biosynthesis
MALHETSSETQPSLSLDSSLSAPTHSAMEDESNAMRPRRRRIVHVSASDINGGAARGAYRLHQARKKMGDDSRIFVLNQETEDASTVRYQPRPGIGPRLSRMLRKEFLQRIHLRYQETKPPGCEHFRDDRSPYGSEIWPQLPEADIINLHWVSDFIDYQSFFPLAAETSLVWTLHDMNPFTGGCHYDLDCGRFQDGCGACPQLGSAKLQDLSRAVLQRKIRALGHLSNKRVRIVAGSHWLASEAQKSQLLSHFDIRTIHYGIDTQSFHPRDRTALRTSLHIPLSAFVVLFAADHIHNRRKGFSLLLEALQLISPSREIHLLSVGNGASPTDLPFPHSQLGYLTSDDILSMFYSAGDCFVIPSLQEVFGLTALEAMACETPIVGFSTGGIPEMVRSGENGRLAPTGDVVALAREIEWMIDHPNEARAMGKAGRVMAETEFTIEHQAQSYGRLYAELEESAGLPRTRKIR